MKIVRISSIPDKYKKKLQPEFQQLKGLDYVEIQKHYFGKYIALADVMTYELNNSGNYEAVELVLNHEMLQKQWADEHNIPYGKQWQHEILEAQIKYYNAEIILVNTNLSSSYLDQIAKGTNLRLKIVWDGYTYSNVSKNKGYDLVLTGFEFIQKKYIDAGMDCEILPFAFDQRILSLISDRKTDRISFIGSLSNGHIERRELLLYLTRHNVDFDLYIDNISIGRKLLSRPMIREIVQRKSIKAYFDMYALQKRNLGVRFGVEMYKQSAESLVNLNFHDMEAGNMRLFESTGLGACLLTDNKPRLNIYFDPEFEVVTFSNGEELLEKVQFLTRNPEKAKEIGENARKKVFEKHLWSHRIQELHEMIRRRI